MKILIVHSSAELYGSDKSLLTYLVHSTSGAHFSVALPERGPLEVALTSSGVRVHLLEVGKVHSSDFTVFGVVKLIGRFWRSWRQLRALHRDHRFDLVYSNSTAVLGGMIFSSLAGLPHIWHIREIITRPGARLLFSVCVNLFSSVVISNSNQTKASIKGLGLLSALRPKRAPHFVVWNGVDNYRISKIDSAFRTQHGIEPSCVVLGLVGRINAWKGHLLLLTAYRQLLDANNANVRTMLLIVGSAYSGQGHFEVELRQKIDALDLGSHVLTLPFRTDIDSIWSEIDIAVVPSTSPEPFGRVAVEAMSHQVPVIAAAHGGLVEIVVDDVTGLLVKPNSADELMAAMGDLVNDSDRRKAMGVAGQKRQRELFSVASYAEGIDRAVRLLANPD